MKAHAPFGAMPVKRFLLYVPVVAVALLAVLFLNLAANAAESRDQAAIAAYNRGDFQTALKLFREEAEAGSLPAHHIVGSMYMEGKGTQQNYAAAMKWFERGEQLGDPNSMSNAAVLYLDGKGVPQDLVKARALLRRAAAITEDASLRDKVWTVHEMTWQKDTQSPPEAWIPFKQAYARKQFATALEEAQKLADKGNALAQYLLGRMYDAGQGTPRNAELSFKWLTLSAAQNQPLAQVLLGNSYMNGRIGPKDEQEAARLLRLSADQGNPDAAMQLGFMYEYGKGLQQDTKEAVRWYTLAAEAYPPGNKKLEMQAKVERLR